MFKLVSHCPLANRGGCGVHLIAFTLWKSSCLGIGCVALTFSDEGLLGAVYDGEGLGGNFAKMRLLQGICVLSL